MENILEVKDLTKKYFSFTLKEVSFSLEPGYILGLSGTVSSGKPKDIPGLQRKRYFL